MGFNLGKKNNTLEDDKRYHYHEYHDNYYKNHHSKHLNYNGHYYNHINIHRPHMHYRYGIKIRLVLFSLGMILSQIWIVILVLYCLVNRRKKEQMVVIIGNIQQ